MPLAHVVCFHPFLLTSTYDCSKLSLISPLPIITYYIGILHRTTITSANGIIDQFSEHLLFPRTYGGEKDFGSRDSKFLEPFRPSPTPLYISIFRGGYTPTTLSFSKCRGSPSLALNLEG